MIVPSLWWEALGLVVYEAYEFSRPGPGCLIGWIN